MYQRNLNIPQEFSKIFDCSGLRRTGALAIVRAWGRFNDNGREIEVKADRITGISNFKGVLIVVPS